MGLSGCLGGIRRLGNRPSTAYCRIFPRIPAYSRFFGFRTFRWGNREDHHEIHERLENPAGMRPKQTKVKVNGKRSLAETGKDACPTLKIGPPGTAWDRINFFLRTKSVEKRSSQRNDPTCWGVPLPPSLGSFRLRSAQATADESADESAGQGDACPTLKIGPPGTAWDRINFFSGQRAWKSGHRSAMTLPVGVCRFRLRSEATADRLCRIKIWRGARVLPLKSAIENPQSPIQ